MCCKIYFPFKILLSFKFVHCISEGNAELAKAMLLIGKSPGQEPGHLLGPLLLGSVQGLLEAGGQQVNTHL